MTHTASPESSQAREAAGRLLEVVGDDHPRQMTISPGLESMHEHQRETELGLRLDQSTALRITSGGLLVLYPTAVYLPAYSNLRGSR